MAYVSLVEIFSECKGAIREGLAERWKTPVDDINANVINCHVDDKYVNGMSCLFS